MNICIIINITNKQLLKPMNIQTICPKCQLTYTLQNPPKQLINCEHILCLSCLNSEILCPIDRKRLERRKYKIQNFQTSQIILDLIHQSKPKQDQLDQKESQQIHDHQAALQKNQEPITVQKVETFPLDIQKADIVQAQIGSVKLQDIKFDRCLLHSKNADLICLKDKCLICSNCGLFGQHKSHTLLAYDTFVLNYTALMEQSYNHYQELKKSQENITQSAITQEITTIIRQKRQTEIKNLKRVIAGLINFIKSTEKLIINQIDQTLQDRKQNLIKQLSFNIWQNKINQYYKEIESMSQGTIDLFKLQKLQRYIDYADQSNPKSYINKQGEYLVAEVDKYSKSIRNQIKQQINGFQCKFNESLNQIIASSFEVKSKNQQKIVKNLQNIKKTNKIQQKKNQSRISSPLSLKKGREEDLLINSKQNSGKNNKMVRDMSPIEPIPRFQQTFDTTFKNSYKQNIITQGKEEIFLQVKEVTLTNGALYVPQHKKVASVISKGFVNNLSTNRQYDPKKDTQNINHIKLHAKANSNNSSHIVERQILSVLNQNKKRKKIDLPQKYTKTYDQLLKDRLDVLDLGGAFLGDQTILSISQLFESRNKLKSAKLMNNKISDDIFPQIIARCRNLSSINLSYNNLSQKSLEWLERQAENLGSLCNITLSNNKIVLRNVKDRIQNLKKKGIKVSL